MPALLRAKEGEVAVSLPATRWEAKVVLIPLLYFLAIAIAEFTTILGKDPLLGVILHAVILTVLFIHASLMAEHPIHKLLLALTLAPLTRILSLAMPLATLPQVDWYPLIYTPLVVAAFMVMRITNLSAKEIGLTLGRIRLQIAIGLAGVALGIMEYLILKPEPLIAELTLATFWFPAIVFIASTGFVEELIFRGVLQQTSQKVLGRWGLVYVSLLFALLHIGFLSILDVAFVFVVALLFAWIVMRTGTLLGVTFAHGLTNVFLYLVLPFIFPILSLALPFNI